MSLRLVTSKFKYNTLAVTISMCTATCVLLIATFLRLMAEDRAVHRAACAVLATTLFLLVMTQLNVRAAKSIPRRQPGDTARFYNAVALDMLVPIGFLLVAGVSGVVLSAFYALGAQSSYDLPWAILMGSFAIGTLGMSADHEEWRRISVLRSKGSDEKFRFPKMLHVILNVATYGLFVVGASWCSYVFSTA